MSYNKPQLLQEIKASGRMYVDKSGYGFVWMPDLKLFPETQEEVEDYEKWNPLQVELPDSLKHPLFIKMNESYRKFLCNKYGFENIVDEPSGYLISLRFSNMAEIQRRFQCTQNNQS